MKRIAMSVFAVVVMAASALGQMGKKSLQEELVGQLKAAEDKLVALAGAMSQEQYSWRPMEGVRSVSEVYMHVVSSNYGLPRMMGVQPPVKIDRAMEKSVTEKAKVIEMLKSSFAHVEEAVGKLSDEDLGKATKMFGQDATYLSVAMLIVAHSHEHLGQSIAYARANKVVPPWSAGGM